MSKLLTALGEKLMINSMNGNIQQSSFNCAMVHKTYDHPEIEIELKIVGTPEALASIVNAIAEAHN